VVYESVTILDNKRVNPYLQPLASMVS